jgi:site-specific recombinase XerD
MKFKAYELLAAQPEAPVALTETERARIVVSAVADDDGTEHPVSLFGDDIWDLSPLFEQTNVKESSKAIEWPSDCPKELVEDVKSALYAWLKRGREGSKPAKAVTVIGTFTASARPFMRWLRDLNVRRFDELKPMHISNYVHHCKTELKLNGDGLKGRLTMLDVLWAFRGDTVHPLGFFPWGDSSFTVVCGVHGPGGRASRQQDAVGKTPLIPPEVQAKIFEYCEGMVRRADEILAEPGLGPMNRPNSRQFALRDACMYLLAITSGMRNDEVMGIETGAGRSETLKGVVYHWVATVEHKTGKGRVEYLVPGLALEVLKVLERYASPLQLELAAELSSLRGRAAAGRTAKQVLEIRRLEKSSKRLFLTCRGNAGRVAGLNNLGCNIALKRVAKAAGVSWDLNTHQARRTYARTFVESRMGRRSLLFLKWQLKHTSMSMTQLYAANPLQDRSLYDEILDELTEFKTELVGNWLGETPLSGGAGREIMRMRAIPIANRSSLVRLTAEQVHIRATGHGWCLAQERGCGGAGLYEATQCVDCKNGVIDDGFRETWQGIYEQQVELLDLDDVGPAAMRRAQREAVLARRVLEDLGVPVVASQTASLMGEVQ